MQDFVHHIAGRLHEDDVNVACLACGYYILAVAEFGTYKSESLLKVVLCVIVAGELYLRCHRNSLGVVLSLGFIVGLRLGGVLVLFNWSVHALGRDWSRGRNGKRNFWNVALDFYNTIKFYTSNDFYFAVMKFRTILNSKLNNGVLSSECGRCYTLCCYAASCECNFNSGFTYTQTCVPLYEIVNAVGCFSLFSYS